MNILFGKAHASDVGLRPSEIAKFRWYGLCGCIVRHQLNQGVAKVINQKKAICRCGSSVLTHLFCRVVRTHGKAECWRFHL
jgi:hypothetical protein